ncbi:trigger factor [bacterium]|nr:trigger factor [bacterium]
MTQNVKADILDSKLCQITLGVEIPSLEVKNEIEKNYLKLQTKVKLPGFRKGKVPMDIVRKKFSQTAEEDAVNNLVSDTLNKVIEEKKIDAISCTQIEDLKFEKEQPLSFRAKIEIRPEFEVKGYKEISVKKKSVDVVGKDVQDAINNLQERNAQLVASDRLIVEKDDFVVINCQGILDGEVLGDWSEKGRLINMAWDNFIEGFNQQLIGAQKNKEKEITIDFPQDYNKKDVAGKKVVFKTEVVEIKSKSLPSLSDDFAKDMGCSDLDDLKKKIEENVKKEKEFQSKQDVEEQLIAGLIKNNPIDVPSSQVDNRLTHLVSKAKKYIVQQGLQPEQAGLTDDALKEKYKEEAYKQVQLFYVFGAISQKENIQVSEEEIKNEIERAINSAGQKEKEKIKKYFNENKETVFQRLLEKKIFDFLVENAKMNHK